MSTYFKENKLGLSIQVIYLLGREQNIVQMIIMQVIIEQKK